MNYFCDNSQSGDVLGVPVIDFSKLTEIYEDYDVILGVQKKIAIEQIGDQLSTCGIKYLLPTEVYKVEGIDAIKVKHDSELDFWKSVDFSSQNRKETDEHYKNVILSIAGKEDDEFLDDEFLKDKVVADFGCGPKGSLNWLENSLMNLGIDVLSAQYTNEFGEEIIKQRMIYVSCGERYIPIPDESIDCLITMNSLDHVSDLKAMCEEIVRIMKPGAMLIGSFNLFEPATACEPQSLTEELLEEVLFKDFNVKSYRLSYLGECDKYENILAGKYIEKPDKSRPCVLWATGIKKS